MTAAAVAAAVGGVVIGDATRVVRGVAPLDRANESQVSFFAKLGYAALFAASRAGVVLVSPELAETPGLCATRVIVARPHEAMLALLPTFYPEPDFVPGIHASAVVDPSAEVAEGARVDALAVVGAGARIGEGAWPDLRRRSLGFLRRAIFAPRSRHSMNQWLSVILFSTRFLPFMMMSFE